MKLRVLVVLQWILCYQGSYFILVIGSLFVIVRYGNYLNRSRVD